MAAAFTRTFWLCRAGREVEGPFTAKALWQALMIHRVEPSDQVCGLTPRSHWHSLRYFFFWQLLGYHVMPKLMATAKAGAFLGIVGGGVFWWWQRHSVATATHDARPEVIEQRHQAAVDAGAAAAAKEEQGMVAAHREKRQIDTWAHKMATGLTLKVMAASAEFTLCQDARQPSRDPFYVIGLSGLAVGDEWKGVLYRCGTKDHQPEAGPAKTLHLFARDPTTGYRLAAKQLSPPTPVPP